MAARSVGHDRALASVLFTDVEGSTELAASLGDKAWRQTLDAHDALASRLIDEHDGRLVSSAGDGLMAVFDSPGRAVACGLALIARAMSEVSLAVRAGVHTGECEIRGDQLAGIAVHVAARVSSLAHGGQLLASRTVKDLVVGDEIAFTAAGSHVLKGVPGKWPVFEASAGAKEQPRRTTRSSAKSKDRPSRAADLKVVLVDDHPLWRQTIRSVLEAAGGVKVLAEGGDGAEALPLVAKHRPDVLVIDMDMPTVHGVDATREVVAGSPDTKVLVLSSSDLPETVLAAVRSGASAYLLKSADATTIHQAILRVAAGELVFPPALSGIVRQGLQAAAAPQAGAGALTEREVEVLDLMSEGLSNAAIGKRLFLSAKTVEAHVSAILTKLDIPPTDDVNRRVRAVVAHLASRSPQVKG